MKNSFLKSFNTIIRNFLLVVAGLAVCAGLCFAFVWPVWYSAINFPSHFSTTVIIVFLLAVIFFIARRIYNAFMACPDAKAKKAYLLHLAFFVLKAAGTVILILFAINAIMTGKKASGIILFISSIVFFSLVSSVSLRISARLKS